MQAGNSQEKNLLYSRTHPISWRELRSFCFQWKWTETNRPSLTLLAEEGTILKQAITPLGLSTIHPQ